MKKPLFLVSLGLALLLGLFLLLRPAPISEPGAPAAHLPAAAVFEIVVSEGRRVSGPETMRVALGSEVTLKVTSDRADELHVHGYDVHAELRANESALLTFKAARAGRFPFELHETALELGVLEVLPP